MNERYDPPPSPPPAYRQAPPPVQPVYVMGPPRTNALAVISLVLGLLWFFWVGSLFAVIFGHVARDQIKQATGSQTGDSMAVAGLVLGYLAFAVPILIVILVAVSPD